MTYAKVAAAAAESPSFRMRASQCRVALLVSHFAPNESGAERQARLQGAELARRGARVLVITHHVPGLPREDFLQGMRIFRWIRSRPWGPLFGITYIVSAVRALRSLRGEYDLIHAHQALWESISLGCARPWLGTIPTLIQPASSGPYGEAHDLRQLKGWRGFRRLAARNTCFAAISQDLVKEWSDLGIAPRRIVRTASGVDADHFHPRTHSHSNVPTVIFTGRLHPQKNLEMFLTAWSQVSVPGVLVVVGQGPQGEALRAHARKLGVDDRVRWVGAVSDPAPLLREADLFVLPSKAEGMSNSLLEAMSSGLPALASAIGGNRELVQPGVTGDLAAWDDPSAWAKMLTWYLTHPAERRVQGEAARSVILRSYALDRVVDRNLRIYENLLAGRCGDAGLPQYGGIES